ncbi:MAG TPA: hypothetical protein VFJ91_00900 [Gaiellaceae bacterium]|nr:hypothetical protein [Gaiellaceae bacterium]
MSVTCDKPSDAWSRRNEVKVQFTARKPDCEYQTLHLTQAEADEVAATIVSAMTQTAADKIGARVVAAMSHEGRDKLLADLLSGLAVDLKNRVRQPGRDKLLEGLLHALAVDLKKRRRPTKS